MFICTQIDSLRNEWNGNWERRRVPLVAAESTLDNYGKASIAVENNPENVEPGPGSGRRKGVRDGGAAEKHNRTLPHISSLAAGLCFTPTPAPGMASRGWSIPEANTPAHANHPKIAR